MQLSALCRTAGGIALSALAALSTAGEIARAPVENVQTLMLDAIRSKAGRAHGVLSGAVADTVSRHFGTASPLYINVTTEKRFKQPGCSRLKVLFWQEGVRFSENAEPGTGSVEFGINYCLDGLAPTSLE